MHVQQATSECCWKDYSLSQIKQVDIAVHCINQVAVTLSSNFLLVIPNVSQQFALNLGKHVNAVLMEQPIATKSVIFYHHYSRGVKV
jgi:hypothetical protein